MSNGISVSFYRKEIRARLIDQIGSIELNLKGHEILAINGMTKKEANERDIRGIVVNIPFFITEKPEENNND